MNTPPLLMGAALVFWGFRTGFLGAGIAMAAVLEGSRLIRRRWDLAPRDFHRLADLSALIVLAMAAVRFSAGTEAMARWIPMAFFPLLAAQAYSTVGGVDLGAIFYVIRQREKKGALAERRTVDLAYPALAMILVAASAANVRDPWFYAGLFVLTGWALWAVRPGRGRAAAWAALLLAAGSLGWVGQAGLHNLHVWLEGRAIEWFTPESPLRNPNRNLTAIGEVGRLKQSDRIVLRVEPHGKGLPVRLLYEAGYNRYQNGLWMASRPGFEPLSPRKGGADWVLQPGVQEKTRVRISKSLDGGQGVLSLPHGAVRVTGLPVLSLRQSRHGVLRVEDGPGLIRYTVGCVPGRPLFNPPDEEDLHLTEKDAQLFSRIAQGQGLTSLPPEEVLAGVARFFREGFQYSLFQGEAPAGNALERFLEERRAGHCELFATATALLLRASGVPSRYAVGYAVQEYSRLEGCYVSRQRHAHAWALAWVDGTWQAADHTPSTWFGAEADDRSPLQPLQDLWRMAVYGFERWRWREGGAGLPAWFIGVAAALVPLLVWRIVRRRRTTRLDRGEMATKKSQGPKPDVWAFHRIERVLEERGFPREPGETPAQWAARVGRGKGEGGAGMDLGLILSLYYRVRFDPEGATPEQQGELERRVDQWVQGFGRESPG